MISTQSEDLPVSNNQQFRQDLIAGLGLRFKRLPSKYLYDETGDRLFQQIMASEEYYVTHCEAEILRDHAQEIALTMGANSPQFDLIELGAGDATKTHYLLKAFMNQTADFRYLPIDISGSIIADLEERLPREIPGLAVEGYKGEYLPMLKKAAESAPGKKLLLFLGGNIGNLGKSEAHAFLKEIRTSLNKGDRILIGFDLMKDPRTILAAYDDSAGYTRQFNLNLLDRINRELDADFDPENFYHYPTYDPATGACKSFIVSRTAHSVKVGEVSFNFAQGEAIQLELSQKYDVVGIATLAAASGYRIVKGFYDQRKWFVDAVMESI